MSESSLCEHGYVYGCPDCSTEQQRAQALLWRLGYRGEAYDLAFVRRVGSVVQFTPDEFLRIVRETIQR